jgi:hypothetical protein
MKVMVMFVASADHFQSPAASSLFGLISTCVGVAARPWAKLKLVVVPSPLKVSVPEFSVG